MTTETSFDARLREAAAAWLASQPEGNLRIARDIIRRREALKTGTFRDDIAVAHENGIVDGMRRALAMCSDRPGDISQTGAEGYIATVQDADEKTGDTR